GRGIERTAVNHAGSPRRARYPSPPSTDIHPAAVVERRKAPGCVVNPGIAPWIDIRPVSVTVGRPTHDCGVREPDRPVFRHLPPSALVVQVFLSDYIFGNITSPG